ncbi:MAG: hypothetical protein ACKOTE_10860, partial [Opitutaceae bacterium]
MNSPGSFAAILSAFPAVLRVVALVAALAGLAGCVSMSRRLEQGALPADWAAALPKPGAPGADLTGIFVERGEQLTDRFIRDGTIGSAAAQSAGSAPCSRRLDIETQPARP